MEWLWKFFDTIILSAAAVTLSIIGRLARLIQEDAHGLQEFTWQRFLWNLPDAAVVGVVAVALTYTLQEYAKVPLYGAIALGGALGYLGLETLMQLFGKTVSQALQKYLGKGKGDA